MIYFKYFSFLLLVALFVSCQQNTIPKEEVLIEIPSPITADGYIIDNKISKEECAEIEKQYGSDLLSSDNESSSYRRIGINDSAAFTIKYKFESDSVKSVEYRWEKLPGQKPAIDVMAVGLVKLFEQRIGKADVEDIFPRDQISTRIDFRDYYTWNKNDSRQYSVDISYYDSGRKGQTRLVLDIKF